MRRVVGIFFMGVCLMNLLSVDSTWAKPPQQENNRLIPGQTVGGTLTDSQFRQLYIFSGTAGQVISVALTATEGDLDPYLLLMNNQNQVLAVSDDDGATNNSVITAYVLPITGDYFIIATRFGHEHGTTTGDYRLTLDDLGATTTTTIADDVIIFNVPETGQITEDTPVIVYRFEGLRGQVINIQLQRTSGNLDPLLDLFDATGVSIISGDDDPTSSDSLNAGIINFLVPSDGVYYIRATRYGRETGDTFGSYVLTVTEIDPSELGIRPSNARLISYGDTVTATIDSDVWARFFQFEGLRGDVVSVIIDREEGNIAPQVSLLDSELRPISISPDLAAVTSARIPGASLPDDDIYYVVVQRYRGEEGTSVGTFSLQINGRPGIGSPDKLEIIYGAEVSGVLDDGKYVEEYVFYGETGDVVTILMRRIDGNLDSLITLYDPDGKALTFNDDIDEDTQDARIQRFRLPVDGYYVIETSRFQRNLGTTSGIYALTLDKVN